MGDEPWRNYPQTAPDEICLDTRLVDERFEDEENDLFEDEDINVRLTDVIDGGNLTLWLLYAGEEGES